MIPAYSARDLQPFRITRLAASHLFPRDKNVSYIIYDRACEYRVGICRRIKCRLRAVLRVATDGVSRQGTAIGRVRLCVCFHLFEPNDL